MPADVAEFYFSAVGSSLFLLAIIGWLLLRRWLAVRSQSQPGLVRLSWTVERPVWRQYLKRKLGPLLSTIAIWMVLYALLMAAISKDQFSPVFWERAVLFSGYALALLLPTAAIVYGLAWWLPGRYVFTEHGVGLVAWTPLLMRPGIGFLDLGFRPWERLEQYRFEDGVLVLKGRRGLLSQGVSEAVVPSGLRQPVEDILREQKLTRLKGPLVEPPRKAGKSAPPRRTLPRRSRRKGSSR